MLIRVEYNDGKIVCFNYYDTEIEEIRVDPDSDLELPILVFKRTMNYYTNTYDNGNVLFPEYFDFNMDFVIYFDGYKIMKYNHEKDDVKVYIKNFKKWLKRKYERK